MTSALTRNMFSTCCRILGFSEAGFSITYHHNIPSYGKFINKLKITHYLTESRLVLAFGDNSKVFFFISSLCIGTESVNLSALSLRILCFPNQLILFSCFFLSLLLNFAKESQSI